MTGPDSWAGRQLTPAEVAMQENRFRWQELTGNSDVLRAIREAAGAMPRPIAAWHKGHAAGVLAQISLWTQDEFADPPDHYTVELIPARKASGTVTAPPIVGGSWNVTCGRCGQQVSVSHERLLKGPVRAILASSAGGSPRDKRFQLA